MFTSITVLLSDGLSNENVIYISLRCLWSENKYGSRNVITIVKCSSQWFYIQLLKN